MGHSSINVSLTYLRGLEIPELTEDDMPVVYNRRLGIYFYFGMQSILQNQVLVKTKIKTISQTLGRKNSEFFLS